MEPFANDFRCPLCHSIDAVTKVSSIVNSGTTTSVGQFGAYGAGQFGTYGARGTGVTVSTTKLAFLLTPPSLPRFHIIGTGDEDNGCMVSLVIFIGLGLAFFGSMFLLSGNDTFLPGLLFFLVGLGLVLYPIIGFIVVARIRRKERPHWQQAMEIWARLYYCARNDIVFLPGFPPECAVSPSQMDELLYSSQVRIRQNIPRDERF